MNQNNPPVDASKSETPSPEQERLDFEAEIAALELEIQDLTQQKTHSEQEAKRLLAKEDRHSGVHFAKEIFEQQQNKLRLDVEIELRQKKINRRKLSLDPSLLF